MKLILTLALFISAQAFALESMTLSPEASKQMKEILVAAGAPVAETFELKTLVCEYTGRHLCILNADEDNAFEFGKSKASKLFKLLAQARVPLEADQRYVAYRLNSVVCNDVCTFEAAPQF